MASPSYLGGPARPDPVHGYRVGHNPALAPDGDNSMHDDSWASDSYPWPGPLGRDPQVQSSWLRLMECATLTFDRHGRLVGLCGDLRGPTLHVFDPQAIKPLANLTLPWRNSESDKPPWQDLCAGAYFLSQL